MISQKLANVKFQEMIPRKKSKKLGTVINSFVSLIKQYWKNMAEIPQKCDFSLGAVKIS